MDGTAGLQGTPGRYSPPQTLTRESRTLATSCLVGDVEPDGGHAGLGDLVLVAGRAVDPGRAAADQFPRNASPSPRLVPVTSAIVLLICMSSPIGRRHRASYGDARIQVTRETRDAVRAVVV